MSGYEETWRPYSCYCMNCGRKIYGYKNSKGNIKMECDRCHAITVRTVLSRRHNRMDVYAPVREAI